MSHTIDVHDTAFMTSVFRSMEESISGDAFSSMWATPRARSWAELYLTEVSKQEAFMHALRNRYFLEALTTAMTKTGCRALLNLGAGFSMYPFQLPEDCIYVEVDRREVVEFKAKRVNQLMSEGRLPNRVVHFESMDLESPYFTNTEIRETLKRVPTFVLLEGVLFFLTKESTTQLFDWITSVVNVKMIGSVSYEVNENEKQVYLRMQKFFSDHLNVDLQGQMVPTSFYESLSHFDLLHHTDEVSYARDFGQELSESEVLNEHFYLLKSKTQDD